jgi:hypothetical protein
VLSWIGLRLQAFSSQFSEAMLLMEQSRYTVIDSFFSANAVSIVHIVLIE